MTASVDRYSLTWKSIEAFASERRKKAVQDLIDGSPLDERKRGQIELIDELLSLGEPPDNRP